MIATLLSMALFFSAPADVFQTRTCNFIISSGPIMDGQYYGVNCRGKTYLTVDSTNKPPPCRGHARISRGRLHACNGSQTYTILN
jgi:hypothetical protein